MSENKAVPIIPVGLIATIGLALSITSFPGGSNSVRAQQRPNFLVILTDNHPVGTERDFMPTTWARLYQQGVQFTNSFATTSECCPSRASILTGMYAHNHQVRVNQDPLTRPTFVDRLHAAGYVTGQVGKYLNSWSGEPRPEFDFWVANQTGAFVYNNPRLNVNGTWSQLSGYITYILRDYAVRFLDETARPDRPFALILSFTAPHDEPTTERGVFTYAVPAPGHENLYPNLAPYRPPNYNELDISDKPNWLQQFRRTPLGPPVQAEFDTRRRRQLQTLKSVDDSIGTVLDTLVRQGRLDNTVIFFLTDNGILWGEHRLSGTGVPYDNSSRIDLTLRYPALVPAPRVEPRLVANIDIAPTIYHLAGLPIPSDVDGRSLVPLLDGTGLGRDELLLEVWPDPILQQPFPPIAAVRTDRFAYAEAEGDRPELYDLQIDPYQLQNRVSDPPYAAVVADLRARLQRLRTSGPCTLPGSTSPFSFSQSGPLVVATWAAAAGATDYVIEVGTATGLSNLVVLPVGAATSLSVVAPPGRYYARVRARNGCGLGPASNEILVVV